MFEQRKTSEGFHKVTLVKSYTDSSKTFVSHDFSDKSTWFYNSLPVTDEVATTTDYINYTFCSDTSKTVIDLNRVTLRRDYPTRQIVVKKNDVVLNSGFTVDPQTKTVVFGSPNTADDVIKISYHIENGSLYEICAAPGKRILIDYVESQFSAGTVFNDYLVFELVLNNPNTGNNDVVAGSTEYRSARDFLNIANNGSVMEPFGEITQKINIFPWDYLTGYTVKPVDDSTTDPYRNEFNKIRMYLRNNVPYSDCELATGTFYCRIA